MDSEPSELEILQKEEVIDKVCCGIRSMPEPVEPVEGAAISNGLFDKRLVSLSNYSDRRSLETKDEPLEAFPKVLEMFPKVLEVFPKVLEVFPKVLEMVPKVLEMVPKVLEVFPKVLEMVPKVLEVFPKVLEMVPKVLEMFPKVLDECPKALETGSERPSMLRHYSVPEPVGELVEPHRPVRLS